MKDSTARRLLVLVILGCLILVSARPFLSDAKQGTPAAAIPNSDLLTEGEVIFANVCMACHQAGGTGIQGVFPALAGNPLITLDDPTYVTRTVITGRGGMPRFGDIFTDQEIAAVVSYVRGGLEGNTAGPVDAAFVASVRLQVDGTPVAESSDVGQKGEGEEPAAATPTR